MKIVQKATELGYRHYAELTIEEIDDLPIGDDDKYMEYYRIAKWLRETYDINISIHRSFSKSHTYLYTVTRGRDFDKAVSPLSLNRTNISYEECLEEALNASLNSIKNNKYKPK